MRPPNHLVSKIYKPTIAMKTFLLLILTILSSCDNKEEFIVKDTQLEEPESQSEKGINLDYKQEMRNFVISISKDAKKNNPNFFVIPQNGVELLSQTGRLFGNPDDNYLDAIDGVGQEDLFYGFVEDDQESPLSSINNLNVFLDFANSKNKAILITDYCSTPAKVDDSYSKNKILNYVSFAADSRNLFSIPSYPLPIVNENSKDIKGIADIKNFLYLINPQNYKTKQSFIEAIRKTNYDLVIIDLFFNDKSVFNKLEVEQLKNKANGGKRKVVCYLSIGEAEIYRYYWNTDWIKNKPEWLDTENPYWKGNYKVKYWMKDWQKIIYGTEQSYLSKILNSKFDGVYLDIIDAFQHFE